MDTRARRSTRLDHRFDTLRAAGVLNLPSWNSPFRRAAGYVVEVAAGDHRGPLYVGDRFYEVVDPARETGLALVVRRTDGS